MTPARTNTLPLLLLGSFIFLLFGIALEATSPFGMIDFKALYWGARAAIQHQNPYEEKQVLATYVAAGGTFPSDPFAAIRIRQAVTRCINLPTTLFLVSPLAHCGAGLAEAIWICLTAGCFLIAAFAAWKLGVQFEPQVAGMLIFLVIINSESLLLLGNSAGLVVSLCTIAVCCLVRERFVLIGIACLALALVMKPQDAGLPWLYFLLAGSTHRKRALATLGLVICLSVPAALWIARVAPHWPHDLNRELATTSQRGEENDPGPASAGGHGIGMIINLQAAISTIKDDPQIYNIASYCICGGLLAFWVFRTLRAPLSEQNAWYAIAAVAALTMLPVYHRAYDARLLLLCVPACAIRWREGGRAAWVALLVTLGSIVITGDLFWMVYLTFLHSYFSSASSLMQKVFLGFQVASAPIVLLAASTFYTWLYFTSKKAVPMPVETSQAV
jgi:hypothetical protein